MKLTRKQNKIPILVCFFVSCFRLQHTVLTASKKSKWKHSKKWRRRIFVALVRSSMKNRMLRRWGMRIESFSSVKMQMTLLRNKIRQIGGKFYPLKHLDAACQHEIVLKILIILIQQLTNNKKVSKLKFDSDT